MDFQGSGRPFEQRDLDEACNTLGVAQAEVWAVLTVETRGFGFLEDRRPHILFERHVFRRRTGGRFDASNPDLSNAKPGGYQGGAREYARLKTAMSLDRDAALESASWGLGQIMGLNHKKAGFPAVTAMIEAMVRDEHMQLVGVANFIKESGLDGALRRQDWTSFARGYNGPGFRKNEYDTRLAAAHAKHKAMSPDLGLRTAQAALLYLGHDPGPVDGVRGRRTRSALIAFQTARGLAATGVLNSTTNARLLREAFPE